MYWDLGDLVGAALVSSVVLWAVEIWSLFFFFLALMVMGRMEE
jgi:hypothetical protein